MFPEIPHLQDAADALPTVSVSLALQVFFRLLHLSAFSEPFLLPSIPFLAFFYPSLLPCS